LLSWTSGNTALNPSPELKPVLVGAIATKPKQSLLPVLIVLFVISYCLMTLLIFEQGRTIENQRGLIRSLFQDSNQLSHMKGEAFQKQHAAAQAQAEANAHSQAQTPSPQDKAGHRKAGPNAKAQKPVPPKAHDGDTLEDVRRVVVAI
jgi:hypothetical protein